MEIKDGIVSMPEHEFTKLQNQYVFIGVFLGLILGVLLVILFDILMDIWLLRA